MYFKKVSTIRGLFEVLLGLLNYPQPPLSPNWCMCYLCPSPPVRTERNHT